MRKLTGILMVLGLIAGILLVGVPPARAANVSISLFGSEAGGWGFTSSSEAIPGPTLTVHQGDTVTISLHSTDGLSHEFFVDLTNQMRPVAGDPTSNPFNATTTVTFVATTAGTFAYFCYFHPQTMKGTFVVQAASGSPAPYGATGAGLNPALLAVTGLGIAVVVGVGIAILLRRR